MAFKSDPRELGRRGGQRSGEARRARAKAAKVKPLTPEEVAAGLEPMTSPEAVRRCLERIQQWACTGQVTAGGASAGVRACAEALKAIELQTELGQVAELAARLDALDAGEKRRPRGVA